MKRGIRLIMLQMSLVLLLSGCFSQSANDLYTPPKPPSDFQNLDAKIHEILAHGGEYAAPIQGNYTQQVQLTDLDGDGVQEAIAFFRMTDPGEELPLKIYIYKQDASGNFQVDTVIEGEGVAIHSVSYVNLGGDDTLELVVSWQISGKVYQLMAYDISQPEPENQELLRVGYTEYVVMDMDMDNRQEILVLSINPIDGKCQGDFYDYDDETGQMALRSTAPLSVEITSISATDKPRAGYLRDGVPALFVTSNVTSGVMTDILAWRDGALTNITLNPETGQSDDTFRTNTDIVLRDINSDGIMELPRPTLLPQPGQVNPTGEFWSVQWIQYDLDGGPWSAFTTYYNDDDGWYVILPETWEGKIVASQADGTGVGESGILFSYWNGDLLRVAEPFLGIYKLTGPNRVARAQQGGRFIIRTVGDTIYAASFIGASWDCGLDEETLGNYFRLIQPY